MPWWILTLLHNSRAWTSLYTLAWTNRQEHLFMAWANYKPSRKHIYRNVRGTRVFCGYQYVWDTPNLAEHDQSGDTYTHTFRVAPLQPTDHVWYYLFSFPGPYGLQCQGPLIHIHPPEIPMPSARVFHSVTQTIPQWTPTYLTFDSELWDDGNFHDPAAPDRLTISEPGLYEIGCGFRWTTYFAHNTSCAIRRNGVNTIAFHTHAVSATGWAGAAFTLHTTMRLQAGDFLQVQVYSSNAFPSDIPNDQLFSPHFWIAQIGPYPA